MSSDVPPTVVVNPQGDKAKDVPPPEPHPVKPEEKPKKPAEE